MSVDTDDLHALIPRYLIADQEDKVYGFLEELKRFLHGGNLNYFGTNDESQWLQGDGAKGLPVVNIATMEKLGVTGILLSNTCDISPDNPRALPPRVSFAPLVSLPKYESALQRAGLGSQQIESKLNDIRAQRVTNIFYLPKDRVLDQDSIAVLDNLYSLPYSETPEVEGGRLFSLSQIGHWLFLFKLSIHFCRFHEGVIRS